jgi:hypothetical protein
LPPEKDPAFKSANWKGLLLEPVKSSSWYELRSDIDGAFPPSFQATVMVPADNVEPAAGETNLGSATAKGMASRSASAERIVGDSLESPKPLNWKSDLEVAAEEDLKQ